MGISKHKTGLEIDAVDKASSKVRKLGKSFDFLSKKSKKLESRFARISAMQKQLRGFTKLGAGMQSFGKKMTVGVTLPIGLMGASIIKSSVDFEQGMNKVEALTGATGKTLDKMREKAKLLGSRTVFSATQAADAMGFLGMAGFKTGQIMASIGPVLNLAAASGIELGRAADITSNIMGAFGIKAKEATRVADVLAAVTSKSNVNMEQLADTMKMAAPVAAQFGLTIEQTAAAAGILGNIGIQGTSAGTALKNAFLGLAAPGSRASKIMKKLGVEISGKSGKMREFSSIMTDMGKAISDLPKATQLKVLNAVFGKIGIAGASELVKQAKAGKLREFGKALNDVDGYAGKMATTLNKGAPGAVKNFGSALEGIKIQIWEKGGIKDGFQSITNGAISTMRWLTKLDPVMLKLSVTIGLVAAAIGPLALIIGTVIKFMPILVSGLAAMGTVLGYVMGAFKIIGIALLFVGKALLLNPIGATITGIAVGAFLLIKYWTPVKTFFSNMWSGIKNIFSSGADYISRKMGAFKSLFGFGPNEQKVTVKNQGSFGKDRSTARSNQAIRGMNQTNTNNAAVSVDFTNLPQGSRINSPGEDFLNVNLGFANI